MTDSIFLLSDDGRMRSLQRRGFLSEDILQRLLADHPELLVGDQIDLSEPRRWILITREAAIPGEEDGSGRWSVDHLYLDQDAVPTLVEVKRSQDTRIRREVVGQLLEYAANAVSYWSPEFMRQRFEDASHAAGLDPTERIRDLVGFEADADDFWERARTNLQAGRVRLLFVADVIPTELRQIVEFLNGQMDPAQVLAIEVKQYKADGVSTLVPTVIGQSVAAQVKKGVSSSSTRRKWDREEFFKDAAERLSSDELDAVRTLYAWAEQHDAQISWGTGAQRGSFSPKFPWVSESRSLLSVFSDGEIWLNTGWFRDDLESRHYAERLGERLRSELQALPVPPDYMEKSVGIPVEAWRPRLPRFLEIVDDVVASSSG